MQTHAHAKYLKISARKLRFSADTVRGSRVVDAENILAATPKKGSIMVASALKSAVANAENNYNMRKSGLHVTSITVDEGPKLKRSRPRSRGMAAPILHRMSHLTITLSDEVVVTPKAARAAARLAAKKASRKPVSPATPATPESVTPANSTTKQPTKKETV